MSSQGSINIVNNTGRYRGRGRASVTEAKTKGADSSVGTQTPSVESNTSSRSASSRSSKDHNGASSVCTTKPTKTKKNKR